MSIVLWMKGSTVDPVHIDLARLSALFPVLNIFIGKPVKYRLEKWVVRQTENWLTYRALRFVIRGTLSKHNSVTAGTSQGLILEPTLFHIFINDLD